MKSYTIVVCVIIVKGIQLFAVYVRVRAKYILMDSKNIFAITVRVGV
jgi:hypothetical protein